MSTKRFLQDSIALTAIAVGMLALNWFGLSRETISRNQLGGFIVGLLCGHAAIYLLELSHVTSEKGRQKLHYSGAFLVFAVTIVLTIVSRRLAYGYFSGLGVTYCFGSSLAALLKRYYKRS